MGVSDSFVIPDYKSLLVWRGTLDFGVLFPHHKEKVEPQLVAYSDLDWGGDVLVRKSTMRHVFLFGGAPISWCSKK